MAKNANGWMHLSQVIVQRLTLVLISGPAGAAVMWSAAAAVGLAPWLEIGVGLGGETPADVGAEAQLVVTLFLLGLCFFLPTNARVMHLEASHRDFKVTMCDVAKAYQAAHSADRAGVFKLKSEFDDVRDRLIYLRAHPELGHLEPDILEMAAQMSRESRELARIYSDERVERARRFLQQRQEEAEEMKERVQIAESTCREIKRWMELVEIEEDKARAQLARLKEDLAELLPLLDLDPRLTEQPDDRVEHSAVHHIAAE